MTDPNPVPGGPDVLERALGDAHDPDNPLGYEAVLAADERAEILPAGEAALDAYGFNAEYVPRRLGGRLGRIDRLMRMMRTVSRRDPTLALGHGFTNYISGSAMWTAGSDVQQKRMADILLSGGKTAAGYNELPHGNDFTRTDLTATPSADGSHYRINGRKQIVNNLGRADAVVLLARTGAGPGNRSHSHLWVDLTQAPADRLRRDYRFPTVGLRGCLIGGADFTDLEVPADAPVGPVGSAMETVLRAFQTTRAVLPGMMVGTADTQLRTVTRFALDRALYGRSVADLPHARATLVGAFLDLLAGDCMATVACRALHVLPGQTSVITAVNKYVVPKVLHRSSQTLGTLLGANSYWRDGRYGIFQKFYRDLPAITFAHANAAVCQATTLPQLPRLAATSWGTAEAPPAALFDLSAPLDDIDYQALELTSRGADQLTALLHDHAGGPALPPAAARIAALLRADLDDLGGRCRRLPPSEHSVVAGRSGFALAERYAQLSMAAACIGVWQHNQNGVDPFLRDDAWLTGALARVAARLGHDVGALPDVVEQRLFAELTAREEDRAGFDLDRSRLAPA
ncbi:acyl-CoA dehydrogenase [Streptomyces coeruleorubidus]|uniref:Acyl-CoA dehydrogenase n=1 Tax=Streptomyces coeruleorubidus TaxID=116188 RepID=A0A5J6I3A6_STRC4|nr:acyl-CoA dehydrogenase [Streptomyces coeruleorubidus]QEV26896.1 acyl-CoA dehydrogenase [Streptomyces coeruleorubidus]GGT62336.1 acyl-CoA dehydrogenase [Streptomyces coeruleorubidus]